MGQADSKYGTALTSLIKWADTESVPHMETGWPGNQILREAGLAEGSQNRLADITAQNGDQLVKALKSVLIEKAVGTVHTRVNNSMHKGEEYAYIDVCRCFSEISVVACPRKPAT